MENKKSESQELLNRVVSLDEFEQMMKEGYKELLPEIIKKFFENVEDKSDEQKS